MANEQVLNTRLQLLYDTYDAWNTEAAKAVVLKAGEVAFVEVTNEDSTKDVIFKVGDGTTTFGNLRWGSANAADVDAWAKKSETEFLEYLNGLLTTQGGLADGPFVKVSDYDEFVTEIKGEDYDKTGEGAIAYKSISTLNKAIADLEAEVSGTDSTSGATIGSRVKGLEDLVGKPAAEGQDPTGLHLADKEIWDYVKDGEGSLISKIDENAQDIKELNDNFDSKVADKVNAMLNTDTNQAAIDTYEEMIAFFADHAEDGATAKEIVADVNTINETLYDETNGLVKKVDEYITSNDEAIDAIEKDIADKDKALWDYVRDAEGSLDKRITANDTDNKALWKYLTGSETATTATSNITERVDSIEQVLVKKTDTLILQCGNVATLTA